MQTPRLRKALLAGAECSVITTPPTHTQTLYMGTRAGTRRGPVIGDHMPPNKLVYSRGRSQLAAWWNELPVIRQVGLPARGGCPRVGPACGRCPRPGRPAQTRRNCLGCPELGPRAALLRA